MPSPTPSLTSDAVIYMPGIMGSELVDAQQKVVWGFRARLLARQVFFGDVMERLKPRPNDGITASRPVQLPVSVPILSGIEPYTALEHRLRTIVLRPEGVRAFAYDWRRSIADAATALAPVARDHLSAWRQRFAALPDEERQGRPTPRLILIGHSMGGLVASWFATVLRDQGGEDVRMVITLGTPFAGAVNALKVLTTGEYLPFGMFAKALRDGTRTMPGVYELLARYRCVDQGDDADGRANPFRRLTADDVSAVGGDAELTTASQATMDALTKAIATDGAGRIRCLVGTTQPTLQSVRFDPGGVAHFAESVADDDSRRREDHRGDGTVFRFAALPDGVTPSYLPQSHGSLSKVPEGVEFAVATATERPLGPFQGASELGVRVPDLAVAGTPFTVEALDAELGAMCQVHDLDDNGLVAIQPLVPRDGVLAVDVVPPAPGAYRISVSAGGLSPVERVVLVAEPPL